MTQTEQSSDLALHTAVTDELRRTPAVDEATVGICVLSGTVTLSGEVQTYAEKKAALAAALGVQGVRAVADALIVHHLSDRPSDSRIAIAASEALHRAASVPATVQATVHGATIMLSGNVSWDFQRAAARSAVDRLPGVVGVWSTMTITRRVLAAPAGASEDTSAALRRTAPLDAGGVEIGVTRNAQTPSGTLGSAAQRQRARQAPWSSSEASTAENRLTVR